MRAFSYFAAIILILGCTPQPPAATTPAATPAAAPSTLQRTPSKFAGGGGSVSLGDYTIASGMQYSESGKPSLFYGSTQAPNAKPEIVYLVAFLHPAEYNSSGSSGGPSGDGEKVAIQQTFSIDGREFRLNLDVLLDAETKAPKSENWRINGEPVDAAKGRLILVDFQSEPLQWQQVEVDFTQLTKELGPIDSEAVARRWIARLRELSPAADEMLK